MDTASGGEGKWFGEAFPSLKDSPVAYFSAEFGLHGSLPIYCRNHRAAVQRTSDDETIRP